MSVSSFGQLQTIAINARCLNQRMTGVQRFTSEVINAWPKAGRVVAVRTRFRGVLGHAFEQLVLPELVGEATLLSPANAGTLMHRRQIVVIHDIATIDAPEWFSLAFSMTYRILMPLVARTACMIATVSEFTKARIVCRLGVSPSKIIVVGNGVEVRPTFLPFERRVKRIIFFGSIEPRKNLARLLEAWRRIESADWELVIAGGRSKLFSEALLDSRCCRNIRFTGHISDLELDELLATSRGFVYPSLYEGFGLPPIEAMGRGCPVVTSVCGAIPEICGRPFTAQSERVHNWSTVRGTPLSGIAYGFSPGDAVAEGAAIYCDPFSIESISIALRQLQRLSKQDFDRLVSNGVERARSFKWSDVAGRLHSMARSLSVKRNVY